MRCSSHPDRIAEQACGVCGTWICGDCVVADTSLRDFICPTCDRSRSALGAEAPVVPRLPPAAVGRRLGSLLLAGLAVAVAAAVLALLLWDRPGNPVGAGGPGFDERPERLRRAFDALESTGLALEAYRAREGRYPEALDDLVPGLLPRLPVDPYHPDGGPLTYRVGGEGVFSRILYSRGPDRLDQRGLPLDPLTRTGDLLYPVE